jgi:hypothetical protein
LDLSTKPGISRPWLNPKREAGGCGQGVCEFLDGEFTELDLLSPIAEHPWHTAR